MILKSNRILILTHLSIDHDAVCSTLLLRHILKKFFEKNNVDIVVQESHWPQFESLNLPGISRIKNISASTSLDLSNYNLIFIVDVNRIERCLHNSKLQDNYLENLIIIDHHDSLTDRQAAVYINDGYSSAVEQIYLTFKDLTGRSFIPDKQISQLTQIGMIADTNCFLYDKVSKKTYQIMSEIVDLYNLNREILMKQLIGTEKNSALVLSNILDHLYFRNDMAYSYLSPHFTSRKKLTPEEITGGTGIFLQSYLRNINGVNWGFLIYKKQKPKVWGVSFRALKNTTNVLKIAKLLDGGGHKWAAGAGVEAKTANEAINKVLKIINEVT